MILWTIQPEEVFDLIQRTGVYHCDINKSGDYDFLSCQYDWLVSQMKKRIGYPPEGVSYPVWAYQRWRLTKRRPDLRAVRWYWGKIGEKHYRLEVDIPDNEVLLTDRNSWDIMLNNGLLSYSEKEYNELEKIYDNMTLERQIEMRNKNWERVFDIRPIYDDW